MIHPLREGVGDDACWSLIGGFQWSIGLVLISSRSPGGAPSLGHLVVDRYLEVVAARLRPNTTRAVASDLNAWLMARESDGTLAGLRRRYLGHADSPSTAEPVSALVAAVGERLDLMPLVAEAKRATGTPVTVPEREARVIDAALAATRKAAREAHRTPLSDRKVRRFFELQIAAAKEIQHATLAHPAGDAPPADLDTALRPALLRIGNRIALLLQQLPAQIDPGDLGAFAGQRLRTPGLSENTRDALVEAILALPEPRRD